MEASEMSGKDQALTVKIDIGFGAQTFSPVVGIGTPPTPHPQASVHSPRFWGEGHTRWRERGWESPNSDVGTYTVVYIRTLWSAKLLLTTFLLFYYVCFLILDAAEYNAWIMSNLG
jgi:hypothetical protein